MSKRKVAVIPKSPAAKIQKTDEKQEYGWKELSQDLLDKKYIGWYGGCNTAWHALASIRANVNLTDFHTKRHKDEFFLKGLDSYIRNPHTQRHWGDICSFDPMGLYGSPPTMSATEACMEIPELMKDGELIPDGVIVRDDLSINIQKCAVDYVWNLPYLAKKIGQDEDVMRQRLVQYTHDPEVADKSKNAYLPPLGGLTIYFFGDVTKLGNPETEVAVRVHDSCCGSDVFGTDICTCRPYLVFAIKGCVEVAQRGGVGMVIYFQKEGRGLGEVTKYRVYNARKNQEGGDSSDTYFAQTENIAGIQDARFQELMPDALRWLGIERIDWLLSMSSEKYDAIVANGIKVMQRVSIPDDYIPKNAHVEINAKIAAGYHADGPIEDVTGKLRTLEMVRERCGDVFNMAKADKTNHFKLDLKKLPAVVKYVTDLTKKNYPDLKVPYHSRWRHFNQTDLDEVVASWKCDKTEKARRLLDLATVSVLMDAGAGADWKYIDSHGNQCNRSEGLAIATMDMFRAGLFSSDVAFPCRVNAHGIKQLTFESFCRGFQIDDKKNPLLGAKGRWDLLQRLADAMIASPGYFGEELKRPGNLVDYVQKNVESNKVSLRVLWQAIIEGLESIWPTSTSGVACMNLNPAGFSGQKRGDVWVYSPLKTIGKPGSDMIPFHKLSQWLTYSLLEPIQDLGITFTDLNLLTGLAEYRNGGLFVDMGVLTLRDTNITADRQFDAGSELIVEWRALTLCLLDLVGEQAAKALGKTTEEFPLACILQGGTWEAGRNVAKEKRANGSPPIQVRSSGTVF